MASTNFKLFDENKTNMMSDTEYNINTQRLNGVQAGIASSQLQNKTLYQTSLVAYSIAQIMMQNGYDANDSAAVSAFVGNMSNSLLQKVLDKATSVEARAGTITNKWISPATMKAAALLLSGGTMSGPINMGNNKITNLADPTDDSDAANKKYVNNSQMFEIITVKSGTLNNSSKKFSDFNMNLTRSQFERFAGVIIKMSFSSTASADYFDLSFGSGSETISVFGVGRQSDLSSKTFSLIVYTNYHYKQNYEDSVNPYIILGNRQTKMASFSNQNTSYLYLRSSQYNGTVTGSISAVLLN